MFVLEDARAMALDPARPPSTQAPPVDDARPPCCPPCGALARRNGRVVLVGNGVRSKPVVVPLVGDDGRLRLVRGHCWARRYLCRSCGKSTLVVPAGVLPGCLYTLPAIIFAWLQVAGLPDGDANSAPAVQTAPPIDQADVPADCVRWRSPYRWARRANRFLPGIAADSGGWRQRLVPALARLTASVGSWSRLELLRIVISTQRRWGFVM